MNIFDVVELTDLLFADVVADGAVAAFVHFV